MGQDPSEIRQQIAQTREEMGDTIDALGYKADVPARAKDKVTGTVDRARESVAGTVGSVKGAVTGKAGSVKDAARTAATSDKAHKAVGVAQSNPLGLAIGSVAAGFLIGMLLPSTRVEDERIGAIADEVKAHARRRSGGRRARQAGREGGRAVGRRDRRRECEPARGGSARDGPGACSGGHRRPIHGQLALARRMETLRAARGHGKARSGGPFAFLPSRRPLRRQPPQGWRPRRGDVSPTDQLCPNGSRKPPCRCVPQGV